MYSASVKGVTVQRTIVVISAGLGVPSSTRMLADQMAAAVQERLGEAGAEAVLDVVDLRDYAADIANNMLAGYAGPALADVISRVAGADAMIAVTPTFSASYSGLFKSFFDVLDPKFLDGMPVLFGATGGSSRHSLVLDMAIRPLFSYLRARTMPTAVYASPEDWGQAGTDALDRRIGLAAAELAAVLAPIPTTTPAPGDTSSARPAVDHKAKRRERETVEMTSLPFEQLLAQTQAR
ncbi:NADPH-dependent FMN reductase [Arthrobacter livingstonensis]|uniref:NADPH-dependent FMN reductase n=1 Tax=Arthrobacter livingstonensis TaxID=670078 RepID=A0A2V5LBZ5_9MICC|nr:NADPH-dependent FMN reductase [Arthrobacter livingstonensis]